jgi:hypothetical protein
MSAATPSDTCPTTVISTHPACDSTTPDGRTQAWALHAVCDPPGSKCDSSSAVKFGSDKLSNCKITTVDANNVVTASTGTDCPTDTFTCACAAPGAYTLSWAKSGGGPPPPAPGALKTCADVQTAAIAHPQGQDSIDANTLCGSDPAHQYCLADSTASGYGFCNNAATTACCTKA